MPRVQPSIALLCRQCVLYAFMFLGFLGSEASVSLCQKCFYAVIFLSSYVSMIFPPLVPLSILSCTGYRGEEEMILFFVCCDRTHGSSSNLIFHPFFPLFSSWSSLLSLSFPLSRLRAEEKRRWSSSSCAATPHVGSAGEKRTNKGRATIGAVLMFVQ